MVMLSGVWWKAELKVLLWEEVEGDGTYKDSTEEDGDWDEDSVSEDETQTEVKFDSGVHMGWRNTSTLTATTGKREVGGSTGTGGGKCKSEEQEMFGPSHAHKTDIQGARILKSPLSSSSSSSSPVPLTPDSASIPSPPKKGHGRIYDDEHGSDNAFKYAYDRDPDHDPSLEPAPLSLPSRTTTAAAPITVTKGEEEQTLHQRNTASSMILPASLLSLYDGVGCGTIDKIERRNAQVIPYKIVRKEYAQLNFGVIVDEEGSTGLPGFLAGGYGNNRKKGEGRKGGEVYEHDALEWATCARIENLPMNEDLRQVVSEGLAWMAELTARFF
ncbi:hypothetical protein F5Y12DRAFT_788962 [Xylaria sp. FL1777]|nr:hypothetical protein F5Y12DRAFT_788962 [Xylaria sp. FL1777]